MTTRGSGVGPFDVTCVLARSSNLYQLSLVVTGLWELASDGLIRLRFAEPRMDDEIQCEDSPVAALEIRQGNGDMVRIGLDMSDRREVYGPSLLEHCQRYFKRSYHQSDVDLLPAEWRDKLLPFGCSYACRSRRQEGLAAALGRAMEGVLHDYNETLPLDAFEQAPEALVEPGIVFQTRLWEEWETDDDVAAVNQSRTQLLYALRDAFPGRLHGGLVGTRYARAEHPDLITAEAQDPGGYIAFSKRHLIAISTRGLHHSVPFKLGEYMAASHCIVSQAVHNRLPGADSPPYLEFSTPEECVEQCERILGDSGLAQALRSASWDYYQREVRPARHMLNVLERGFGQR